MSKRIFSNRGGMQIICIVGIHQNSNFYHYIVLSEVDILRYPVDIVDMIWEYDDTSHTYNVDNAVTETLEHLLHTISQYGFPEAYPIELNSFSGSGFLGENKKLITIKPKLKISAIIKNNTIEK